MTEGTAPPARNDPLQGPTHDGGGKSTRSSEEEIRRDRRFSDGLIKSSIDGILAFDTEMRLTLWNPALETMTGLAAQDVIGRDIGHTLPHLGAYGGIDDVRATLHGATRIVSGQRYHIPATGRTGFFEARYAPLYDEDREILGGLVVIRDTTETKQRDDEIRAARQKLAKSEKLAALGTLVSGVGHELRTPMSYINNHLYLIKMLGERMQAEDPASAPVAEELIRRATSSMKGIERMSTLLDDLRATYRAGDAGVKEVDLKEVVEHALRLFRGAYEGPVSIEADLRPTGLVRLDTGRIQQVVINLLNNAADAMPEGGTVRIGTTSTPHGAELIVEDTGVGMPPPVQAEIFHPFYTTKKEGSGLGLYLVKQIIDRHLGQIECRSMEGEGTTFRILIPQRNGAGEAAPILRPTERRA